MPKRDARSLAGGGESDPNIIVIALAATLIVVIGYMLWVIARIKQVKLRGMARVTVHIVTNRQKVSRKLFNV